MSATVASDYVFVPQVFMDHVAAYFDRKLVYGALAVRDETLATRPGLTVEFPYFKRIGDAEEPEEDEALNVDNISDDSFTATVKEIGKAVGIKKKAFKKNGAGQDAQVAEVQRQIGIVMAQKVDKDLLKEFSTTGNYLDGFTATVAADTFNIRTILRAKMLGFGDRSDEAQVIFCHSRQALDLMSDPNSGFLKADANDPMIRISGFIGSILGMAIIQVDTVPQGPTIDGKDSFHAFIHSAEPYGFLVKQEMETEFDYDILNREYIWTGNQWYAVKSFHGKIDPENVRTVRMTTTVTN